MSLYELPSLYLQCKLMTKEDNIIIATDKMHPCSKNLHFLAFYLILAINSDYWTSSVEHISQELK